MKRLIMLLILTISISCSNSTSNSDLANDKLPLDSGKSWAFIDSTFDENGILMEVDSSKLGIRENITINYQGKNIEVNFWNWYDYRENKFFDFKWLCKNENDGFYLYGGMNEDSCFIFPKSLLLKYPVSEGDIWEHFIFSYLSKDSTFYIRDTVDVTCLSKEEPFNTLLGEIECLVYYYQKEENDRTNDIYLYFSKQIGYVGYVRKIDSVIRRKKVLKQSKTLNSVEKLDIFNPSGSSTKKTVFNPYNN